MRLLALTMALFVITGCASLLGDQDPARVCGPDVAEVPCGAGVEADTRYDFALLTHCGIEWAYFDGRYWVPGRPTDPSPNWASIEHGTMTLVDRDNAHFAGSSGGDVPFVPAHRSFRPETCA